MISFIKRILLVFSVALVLTVPNMAFAKNEVIVVEKPSALAMTGDFFIARPILLGITVVGTAIFLVSLPFSLAGGNAKEAGDNLVLKPAQTTFVRCLGCVHPGYKNDVDDLKGSE